MFVILWGKNFIIYLKITQLAIYVSSSVQYIAFKHDFRHVEYLIHMQISPVVPNRLLWLCFSPSLLAFHAIYCYWTRILSRLIHSTCILGSLITFDRLNNSLHIPLFLANTFIKNPDRWKNRSEEMFPTFHGIITRALKDLRRSTWPTITNAKFDYLVKGTTTSSTLR